MTHRTRYNEGHLIDVTLPLFTMQERTSETGLYSMGGREVAMLRQEVDELRRRLADAQRQHDTEVVERQKVRNDHLRPTTR